MSRKKNAAMVTAGILIGMTMACPAAYAAVEYLKACLLYTSSYFHLHGVQPEGQCAHHPVLGDEPVSYTHLVV